MHFILADDLIYLFFLRQPVFPEKSLALKPEEQGIFIADIKFISLRDFKQDCLWLMDLDPEIIIMLQEIKILIPVLHIPGFKTSIVILLQKLPVCNHS